MSPQSRLRLVSEARGILGVPDDASELELKLAWKKLAFEMHPDRGHGTNDQLANINAAYSLLCEQASSSEPVPSEFKETSAATPVRPRPSVTARVSSFGAEQQAACAELVKEEAEGHGHIAIAVERRGRKLTYVVETELCEGTNRVAMPSGVLIDPRNLEFKSLAFKAGEAGAGNLILPDEITAEMFPGASQVVVRFGDPEEL